MVWNDVSPKCYLETGYPDIQVSGYHIPTSMLLFCFCCSASLFSTKLNKKKFVFKRAFKTFSTSRQQLCRATKCIRWQFFTKVMRVLSVTSFYIFNQKSLQIGMPIPGDFHSSGIRGSKEWQFVIPQGSGKLTLITRVPQGIWGSILFQI